MLIALAYLIVAGLWIAYSDRLVAALVPDPEPLTTYQTYKGLAFVFVTGAVLFVLLHAGFRRQERIEDRVRYLAKRLAETETIERAQLARELHDQVGQNLTALGINLNIMRSQLPEAAVEPLAPRIADCLDLVDQTAERIRNVMTDLRSPVLDDYGLLAALRWYGEEFNRRTRLNVTVEGEEPEPRLPAYLENTLFRIAQEALTNVARHASAIWVTIQVTVQDSTVILEIADNGVGFDVARAMAPVGQTRWGLNTMEERVEAVGGSFRVESSPGMGTRVTVEVPR